MRSVIAAIVLVAACTADHHDSCAQAEQIVARCTGQTPQLACSADNDAAYADIIQTYDDSGCSGFGSGKADGFGCELLSVFGLCTPTPLAPLFPDPSLRVTRYPILLAHGFATSTTNFWRFNGVDTDLEQFGYTVALGSVPPFDTSEVRATYLADEVRALLASSGAAKVNLVCFSQGGLDCRYLASPNGLAMGDVVASITTLSSPHRGTYVADAALPYLLAGGSGERTAVDAIATMVGDTFSDLASQSHLVAALQEIAEANMPAWNQTIVDAPGVYYQSFAGFSHVAGVTLSGIEDSIAAACVDDTGAPAIFRHPSTYDTMNALLVASAAFVGHFDPLHPSAALPNDGVSAVFSSKWGTFRGCYPADHLDQVGQIDHTGMDVDTGFDHARLYRWIASDLAERGY